MKSVSAVIPTFNSAQYIPKAIQSVLAQTYPITEIIVIDDGSTDNTKAVVEGFRKYSLKYYHQHNGGPSAARNSGILKSSGECIAFLDADDEWLPTKIEKQMVLLNSNESIGLVTCGRLMFDGQEHCVEVIPNINHLSRHALLKKLMMSNVIGGGSSVLARRVCFEHVGMFDANLLVSEDADMWFRICREYEYKSVDEPLLRYCIAPSSQSSQALRNLSSQFAYLKKIENVYKFETNWYYKLSVRSYRYMEASWSSMESGDRYHTWLLIAKSVGVNPVFFLSSFVSVAFLFRLMLGIRLVKFLAKLRKSL